MTDTDDAIKVIQTAIGAITIDADHVRIDQQANDNGPVSTLTLSRELFR